MPCETPMCRRQFFEALQCARKEPPQTPEVENTSIAQSILLYHKTFRQQPLAFLDYIN